MENYYYRQDFVSFAGINFKYAALKNLFYLSVIIVLFIWDVNAMGQALEGKPSFVGGFSIHAGKIVRNAPSVPKSSLAVVTEWNFLRQTHGEKDWQRNLGLPQTGISFYYGGLGNKADLGRIAAIVPTFILNTTNTRWYIPRVEFGLGISYFNNPFKPGENEVNYYIGSSLAAFAHISVYTEKMLWKHLAFKAGFDVLHSSNGHTQIPNVGINLPSVFFGLNYYSGPEPLSYSDKRPVVVPQVIRLNIRTGIGMHELAFTTGPVGTAKYAIYVTDIYLSRRFGKVSNVHLGLALKFYNSFYQYMVRNENFALQGKGNATVVSIFVAHELMMGHIGFLTQAGVNVFNPFYREYTKQFKHISGVKSELDKYFPTRLGLQYYFRDPEFRLRSNVFAGIYIKANFGQADFICTQIGFVF